MNKIKKLLYVGAAALSLSLAGCIEDGNAEREYFDRIGYTTAVVVSRDYVPTETKSKFAITDPGYNLTFQGDKIRFKVKNLDLFNKFKINDEVNIKYLEKCISTYKDMDRDGKKELLETRVVNKEFLDAQLIK